MRAFYSSQMPGKNKGRDCGRAVTSYMLCHENCVPEVHVPYFSLLQIVRSIDYVPAIFPHYNTELLGLGKTSRESEADIDTHHLS